jgi:Flp pilus assembly pilin Flp
MLLLPGLHWLWVWLMRSLRDLSAGERGQDLAEYCLLTALVALIAVAILIHLSGGMQALWSGANASLVAGNSATSGTTSGADAATSAPAH